MASEFNSFRIEDIALEMGDAPFGSNLKNDDYTEDGVLVLQGKNIQGRLCDWSDKRHTSIEKYKSLSRSQCFVGDLVFPKVGTIGKVGILSPCTGYDYYVLSTNTMRLRVDPKKADPLYIYYYFTWNKTVDLIHALNSKSVQPVFNFTTLKNFSVVLPSLKDQKHYAHILGSLDDKIELNRQMNATLEAIARALFQSWFVDFDPVHAKANGQPPVGMDAETAALFPDSFEETEIGLVPRGWQFSTLAEYAKLNPESWSRNTAPTNILYVDLANTKWGTIEETQNFIWEDAPSRAQRVLRPGDTIVGTVRPGNGSFSLIREEGLTGSTGFAVLRPQKAIYEEYIYLAATSPDNIEQLSRLADGGAYPAVRPDVVLTTQAVQSSDPLLQSFSDIVKPFMLRIAANQRESRTLAELRDTLLPKLMSGQLRVPEAAEIMETVA